MRSIFTGYVGMFLRISEEKEMSKVSLQKCLRKWSVCMKVFEGDKRAVCDTCRYRGYKSWKSGMSM